MAIVLKQRGDFKKTERYLNRNKNLDRLLSILQSYGQRGVEALRSATPKDTGLTSNSWEYAINRKGSVFSIEFRNTNIQNGVPIAIILQYGHGTRNGGYVAGIDYINPAVRPIFNELANEVWKEVTDV